MESGDVKSNACNSKTIWCIDLDSVNCILFYINVAV